MFVINSADELVLVSSGYQLLVRQRWSLAGTKQITLIQTAQDYFTLYGHDSPFDGVVYDAEYHVFICIAVSSNSGVREMIIPESLVLKGDLSFLQEVVDA
jgi:hypothetical protein